MQYKFS